MIKLNKEQQDIKNDVRNFLVMKNANGTTRTQISERLTPFGLKLPLNPTTIKSGPKGEILV